MAVCSQCGAARPPTQTPCAKCGALPSSPSVPELELGPTARPVPKPPRPRKEAKELQIDLAYDPRGAFGAPDIAPSSSKAQSASAPSAPPNSAREIEVRRIQAPSTPPDAGSDVRLLADYGEVPGHWLQSPLYALRVLKRHRELRRALAARKEEAARAAAEAEDALVALANEVRPIAEKLPSFADVMSVLRRAEELMRMRDRVITAENEAEMARLASADARLSKLVAECETARTEEREAAAQLVAAQEAVAREEMHLKRTETELRAAQREPSGMRE